MKIRTGFVSNSSSSSYVIAYTKPDVCPHCGRSDVDIIKLIENSNNNDDTYVSTKGYKEVLNDLKSWFLEEEDDIKKEMKQLKSKDMEFAILFVSYHDEVTQELLENSKSIKILYTTN